MKQIVLCISFVLILSMGYAQRWSGQFNNCNTTSWQNTRWNNNWNNNNWNNNRNNSWNNNNWNNGWGNTNRMGGWGNSWNQGTALGVAAINGLTQIITTAIIADAAKDVVGSTNSNSNSTIIRTPETAKQCWDEWTNAAGETFREYYPCH